MANGIGNLLGGTTQVTAQEPKFIDKLALAFQGAGAGLLGQGEQFQNRMMRMREQELVRQQQEKQMMEQRREAAAMDLLGADQLLKRGDIEGAKQLADNRIENIRALGGDPGDTLMFKEMLDAGDIQGANELVQTGISRARAARIIPQAEGLTAGQREFESMTADLSPEEKERARRIRLGLEARASSRETIEQEALRAARKEAAKGGAKGKTERLQGFVDVGSQAADATAITRRGLELLDDVKTGGIDAAALRAKQIFGVEGADEAELSTNLGKAVLSQLRATFGAAFTAKEGEQLQRIEAGFGKSTAGNKRLLGQALKLSERAAKRGIRAAEQLGDDFAADEIRGALDFSITPQEDRKTQQARPTGRTATNPQTGQTLREFSDGTWR